MIGNSTRLRDLPWWSFLFCPQSLVSLGRTIPKWCFSETIFSAFSQIGWLPCQIAAYRILRFVIKYSPFSKRFDWIFLTWGFFLIVFFLFIQFSVLNRGTFESSGMGNSVKYLYLHPNETRENKEKASKLINEWDPNWFPRVVLQRLEDFQEP